VDRLSALVALRWRLDLRALLGARERLVGLALLVPILALGSLAAAGVAFFGVRAMERAHPEWVLPLLSAAATAIGVLWALSPLLAGLALSETHDLSRLLHFPVPLSTLVASSLLANLAEPMVLATMPLLLAVAAALSSGPGTFVLAAAGVVAGFVFALVAAQAAGLVLLGLARNRRAQDRALFLGLGLGFLLSLLPVLLLMGGRSGGWLRVAWRLVVERDLFALSPFAWGSRAAVHTGRGEVLPALAWGLAALGAVVVMVGVSAALARRIYRGELSLGGSSGGTAPAARMVLPGPLGALLEKELRVTWRDPRLKVLLFTGLVGPLVLLFLLGGAGPGSRRTLFLLVAAASGLGLFGSNALGLERRGILLLLGFPVPRWQVLVAKNAVVALLRLPGLAVLVAAAGFLLSPGEALAVLATALTTALACAGADNYASVLFPVAAPGAGRNPYGPASGGRGLGAAVVSGLLLTLAMAIAAPFAFLSALPWLLGAPWLLGLTGPLAVAGAAAVYAMMVAGAAGLLARREPEVLARVLSEE